MNRRESGFTLIEAFIVMVIIGLLVSVIMPKFFLMVTTAKQSAAKGYLATLRSATSLYHADNAVYPYQNAVLPMTDPEGRKYDSIDQPDEKENNQWVPVHLSKWPPGIRIGMREWAANSGITHEGGNDLRIVGRPLSPKSNHNWDEELIYIRSTGEIYINCNLTDKEGKTINDW